MKQTDARRPISIREFLSVSHALGLPKALIAITVAFTALSTLFEGAGLVMLVPVYQYLDATGNISLLIEQHEQWQWIDSAFRYFGLQPSIEGLVLFAIVMVAFRQVATFSRLLVLAKARETMNRKVRETVFRHYLAATLSSQEKLAKGDIINDLTLELQRYGTGLMGAVNIAGIAALATVYAILVFNISWELTLASIAMIVLGLFPVRFLYTKMGKAGHESTAANNQTGRFLMERLQAARLIRLAGIEAAEWENMRHFASKQQETTVQVDRLMAGIAISVEPVILTLALGLLIFSINILHLEIETLGLFLVIVLRLMPVAKDFMKARQLVASCSGSAAAIKGRIAVLKADREVDSGTIEFTHLDNSITLEDVSFQYEADDSTALRNLNLTIPAKKILAIIGPSGSGKSTLVDMLPRLRSVSKGRICFDGTPIDQFTLTSLRRGIAYVPQTPQIFDASIADHIRLGKDHASLEDVKAAARLAGAADFIEGLPDGYDTRVGEGGSRLSGGQKQRLDLARAIIRNAPILLLDEPTSNLDAKSESEFVNALERINRECETTIIVVAHRLTTIKDADMIVVLKSGKIEASGPHDELIKTSMWYKNLMHPTGPGGRKQ
ncbi:ABC transporter ATP-binding protein [Aestuariispira ectoiniformans]|uniref:ABC transporter ATP-binding protein n=1 Tax=Aestuariispira ectoiniformans TaxID=2775080 RepID=UPI00223AAF4A|nr:ABC transporter ATP-binding protein [Aestuariispira ectoiniformans]